MAGTYFGYAERQANSQVNWFQVSKDLTDSLNKEVQLREQKKADIDEASRKFGQELENAPQGNSDLVNQFTTDFAGDMQDYRLMTLRLLKAGQLKPKDYALMMQNGMDGTKNLFNLAKEYQQEYAVKMERAQSTDPKNAGSMAELQAMEMVEGFANLRDVKALINPTTGAINVGKMVEGPDGVRVLAEGNDNYMTVNQLRNRIKDKINKYDLNGELKKEEALIGETAKVVYKAATLNSQSLIKTIKDKTLRKGLSQEGRDSIDAYLGLEDKIVESKLSNPYNISSVLYDWSGGIDPETQKPYQMVTDKKLAEQSSHYILFTYKGGLFQPVFDATENGKKQREVAKEFVREKLRGMLPQEEEAKIGSQIQLQEKRAKTAAEVADEEKKNQARNFGFQLGKLVSGTEDEKRAAMDYFKSLEGLEGTELTAQGVQVRKDGSLIPFNYGNNTPEKLGRSLVRALNTAGLPEDVIVSEMIKNIGGKTTIDKTPIGYRGKVALDYGAEVGKYAVPNVESSVVPDDPETTVKNLTDKFGKLGFSFAGDTRGIFRDDYVQVTAPDGKQSDWIKIDELNNLGQIINFIQENRDDKIAEQVFGSKVPSTPAATPSKTTVTGGTVR